MSVETLDRPLFSTRERQPRVRDALTRIRSHIATTALQYHETLVNGTRISTKMETNAPSGSYKIRGALNALTQRPYHHVVTSAGNFGAGAALVANWFDIPMTIVAPETTPIAKRRNILELGGRSVRLVLSGQTYSEARLASTEIAMNEDLPTLEAFDDLDVIEGQGTVMAEITKQAPETDLVFVQVGGAGLLSGTLQDISESGAATRVVAVQFEGNDSLSRTLASDEIVSASNLDVSCDGIAVDRIGYHCARLVRAHRGLLAGIVTVSRAEVGREIHDEDMRRQQLVPDYGVDVAYEGFPETTGFVSLAGAHKYARMVPSPNQAWVAIMTGANTDPERESLLRDAYYAQAYGQK